MNQWSGRPVLTPGANSLSSQVVTPEPGEKISITMSHTQMEDLNKGPAIVIEDRGNRLKITEKWPLKLFCRTLFCSVTNVVIIVALLQVMMGLVTGGVQVVNNHDATHADYLLVLMISMLSTVAGIATVASLGFRVKGCLSGTLIIVCTAAVVFLTTTRPQLPPRLFGSEDTSQIIFHTTRHDCMMMVGKQKDECLLQHLMARLVLLCLSSTNLVLAIFAAGLICAEKFGKAKTESEKKKESESEFPN